MNALALLRLVRVARALRNRSPSSGHGVTGPQVPRRRFARRALLVGAGAVAAAFAGMTGTLDHLAPQARDPEYGRRLTQLKARIAEHPGRPLVAVLGSSRVSFGLRAAAWEEARPGTPADPLVFNLGTMGGGPLFQLMTLRRLYADGIRPSAVVAEYWPPFLGHDRWPTEAWLIDPARLHPSDRPLVREFFPDPAATERAMRANRLNPFSENRTRLLAQLAPRWLPQAKRVDAAWADLDAFGWVPGLDETGENPGRTKRVEHAGTIYRPQLAAYRVGPVADRLLREVFSLARGNGAAVAVVYLPESSEFRSWYTPAAEAAVAGHRAGLEVPQIDARTWAADDRLADGFHLTQRGAAEFGARFGPAVAAALPELTRP